MYNHRPGVPRPLTNPIHGRVPHPPFLNNGYCDCAPPPPPPLPPYPDSGCMVGNTFMLLNNTPYLYDNTRTHYGQRISVAENVITRVSQRRDPCCISFSAVFDMTEGTITNTVLNHYLEELTKSNNSLDGVFPIMRDNIKFRLTYTIHDVHGGIIYTGTDMCVSREMKYHATNIRDYFLNSCRGSFTFRVPQIDFRCMNTITLNNITATVDVLNTNAHITNNLNPYYQFTDNNTRIAVQHDVIMSEMTPDVEVAIATCDINQTFACKYISDMNMKLTFTSYMSNLISVQNTFNLWEAISDSPSIDEDDEDIKQLQQDLNDMRDTVDTLSTELEQTKDILNSMTGGEVYNKTQIDNLMRGKVDKREGFGLSSNDYTDEDRELLYSLATSNQIVFGTHWEFPNVGKENTLYIATDEGRSYYWDPISQIYMNLDKDEFKVDVIQSIL